MIRRLVGPATVLGLSLLATAVLADNPDGDGDTVERPPIESLMPDAEIPGLFLTMTGDADTTNDEADPEVHYLVPEEQLDKTVALPESVEGLPGHLGINVWRQDGDMKVAGSMDVTGYRMDYKVEGGSFSFHSDHVAIQTPVDAAGAMTMVSDLVDMGMSAAAMGRPD